MRARLKISVIVATHDRRDVLARTLPTLLSQDFPTDEYEVVVVIDGSSDGTRELLDETKSNCALKVIEQSNRGLAAARNAGLKAVRGEVVLFIDDDLVCDPNLLREHLMLHDSGAPRVVSGSVLTSPESPRGLATDLEEEEGRSVQATNSDIEISPDKGVVCANSSVGRELLVKVGGFDERFLFALEDVDLGLRLSKMGAQFMFCSNALAYQIYVKTVSQLVYNDAPWYGRSEVLLCRKHPEYRPRSRLAVLFTGACWKRRAWQFLSRSGYTVDAAIGLALSLAERTRSVAIARHAGIRLLAVHRNIHVLRGAAECVGSMHALRSEFGDFYEASGGSRES
jgi:GT2 family glycosyltransferase